MITSFLSLLNIASKQIEWILDKALPDIVLSKQSITLDSDNLTDTFSITTNSDGNLSIVSNDDSIVTVSLSCNTATVTAIANGNVTIAVGITEDDNYLSNSMILSVTCNLSIPLVNCTPEQIKEIVNSGKTSTMWSVGDTTAIITMNGNVSDGLALDNYQCKAILIGLDHNMTKETGSKHSAHFILGRDTSNNEIAFCGSDYGTWRASGTWFNHRSSAIGTASNSGGWKNSNLRTNIMLKFKSALPSAWQNILGTINKYSDNTGDGSNKTSDVTTTSDQLFLLAEYEVFGTITYANAAEQNNQQQYTYFSNGNGLVRRNHQKTGSSVYWWLRSVDATRTDNFVGFTVNYGVYSLNSYNTYAVVPGFAVIQS